MLLKLSNFSRRQMEAKKMMVLVCAKGIIIRPGYLAFFLMRLREKVPGTFRKGIALRMFLDTKVRVEVPVLRCELP